MATPQADEAYEQKNVHEVYQQIAQHFSATRYKVCLSDWLQQYTKLTVPQPWPIVEQFLQGLAPGSVGLDVGCGNGKNLMVNRDVFIVASDRYVIKVWIFFFFFYSYGYWFTPLRGWSFRSLSSYCMALIDPIADLKTWLA
jgi:hypothetical protein